MKKSMCITCGKTAYVSKRSIPALCDDCIAGMIASRKWGKSQK